MNSHGVAPEQWSMLVGSAGKLLILLAFVLNLGSAVLWTASHRKPSLSRWAGLGFALGVGAFFVAFVALSSLFMTGQFQYQYVFDHSAIEYEWKYKIAGVWSGQEGSFLLWALGSSLFGLLAAPKTGIDRRWFTVVFALFLAALAGILMYESPFRLTPEIHGELLRAENGKGMPPSLLNYWVTIHPPTIFLGFGSLTVLYSWAMAALIRRNLKTWIDGVRPWAILSATLLGLGLCMGGFWAYETLGWGGFWMWDPVENTSFVPWAATAAFIHGVFIQKAKGKWMYGNVFLAAIPFLSFLYGTFLTRSGFLTDTSVHSFAKMDQKALWILIGIGLTAVLTFVGLYVDRLLTERRVAKEAPITEDQTGVLQKELMYATSAWLLTATALITAIGMSVPFIQSLKNQPSKVVEEHLYHQVLAWPFPFIMLGMAITPFLTWRPARFSDLANKLLNALAVSIGIIGIGSPSWPGMK